MGRGNCGHHILFLGTSSCLLVCDVDGSSANDGSVDGLLVPSDDLADHFVLKFCNIISLSSISFGSAEEGASSFLYGRAHNVGGD